MSCAIPQMTFLPWTQDNEKAAAARAEMVALLLSPDIWEMQRVDGTTQKDCEDPAFPEGTFIAVFHADEAAVGYVLFIPKSPGVWEQHTAFDKAHRGRYALAAVEEAHSAMFMQTDAWQLISPCPEWHPAASIFAKSLGATLGFRNHSAYTRDGRKQWADIYTLTIAAWAYKVHGQFEGLGEEWHEAVFQDIEPHHEEDPTHNGFLGLAVAMAKFNVQKAIALYNANAQLAGYHLANVVLTHSSGLCVIDIGNAWITMDGDKVKAAVPFPCPPLEQSQQSQVPVQASTVLPQQAAPGESKSEPSPVSPT